jgi:superoxide oxidase
MEVTPYSRPRIALHNIMAVLIICLYAFGLALESIPKDIRLTYINLHTIGGLLVFVLLLVRLIARMVSPTPPFPASMGPGFVRAAHLGHFALYALMAIVPLVGLGMRITNGKPIDFFVFTLQPLMEKNESVHHLLEEAHEVCANVLIFLVLGHVAVALYHQFALKDNLLYRLSAKGK